MSTPRFYLYYDEAGPLTEIDLGEGLSNLNEDESPDRNVVIAADGASFSSLAGYTYVVDIELQLFGGAQKSSLERKLRALANHVNRGGKVGFSLDGSKTFGCILPGTPEAGRASFVIPGNAFTSWSSAGTVSNGDEVVIETPAPEWRRDILPVTSYLSGNINTSEAIRMSMRLHPLLRYRHFWPVLYSTPDDGKMAVSPVTWQGIAYTLRWTARYSPDLAWSLTSGGEATAMVSTVGATSLGATSLRPTTALFGAARGDTIESILGRASLGRR